MAFHLKSEMELSISKDALREDLVVTVFNGPFTDIEFCTSVTDFTNIYHIKFSLLIVPPLRSCIKLHDLLLNNGEYELLEMNDCQSSHWQWNESMVWGHVSGICFIEMRLNYRLVFPGTMVVVFMDDNKISSIHLW